MRLLALLAAGLFAVTLMAAPVPKEKVKDVDAILGTWKVEKLDEGGGKGPPAEKVATMRMTFKKDGKFTLLDYGGNEVEGAYKLGTEGKEIDLTPEGSQGSVIGLYKLESDAMTIVACESREKKRPTEFKADERTGTTVITFKRVTDEK